MIRSLCVLALLFSELAFAQPIVAPSTPLSFEVVSIRPSNPGTRTGFFWQTTPDGYHVSGQSLRSTILMAYFPQGFAYWSGRIVGSPSWLDDPYDIDARVAATDMAAWQAQGVSLDRKPMLQQMLQTTLADRCHLHFHRVPGELDGFRIELGKTSPRLAESRPGSTLPQGLKLPDGGVMVPSGGGMLNFYSASMADLAAALSMRSRGHPVRDQTGLTGRYDFTLNWIHDPDHPERDGVTSSNDSDPLSHWDVNALGLRLIRAKLPIDNLVIDHIERPSEN